MDEVTRAAGLEPDVDVGSLPPTVDNLQKLRGWLIDNQNTTMGVVWWLAAGGSNEWSYIVVNNATLVPDQFTSRPVVKGRVDISLELHYAVNQAIAHVAHGSTTEPAISYSMQAYPSSDEEAANRAAEEFDKSFSVHFVMMAFLFLFHGALAEITHEKVNKLRQGLLLMGTKESAYLLSFLLFYGVWALYSVAVVNIIGKLFGLGFWSKVDNSFLIVFFTVYALNLVTFGMLVTGIFHSLKTAISMASIYYVFCLIFMFMDTTFLSDLLLGSEKAKNWATFLSLFPTWNFYKIMRDVRIIIYGAGFFVNREPTNWTWDNLDDEQTRVNLDNFSVRTIPSTRDTLILMIVQAAAYMVATWVLGKVNPGEYGAFQSPLSLSFWGLAKAHKSDYDFPPEWKPYFEPGADEDVVAAAAEVFDRNKASKAGLVFAGMSKRYRRSLLDLEGFSALSKLTFIQPNGSCLALLGHNGAGKTTAINCMIGINSPTAGDAVIMGYSAKDSVGVIQGFLGVCPQHDVLWDDLTAREHLSLFAQLKGVASEHLKKEADGALAAVHLTSVADQFVSSFSGGMKRRLSVAISTVANPKIIVMDEPTSGLDPVNKRHIWDLVLKLKKTKLILLTTHAMAEADALADRIAVLANGRLKAIGTSLRLKDLYGSGYHVSIQTDPGSEGRVKAFVDRKLESTARLDASNAGSLHFSVPRHEQSRLPPFIRALEKEAKAGKIRDFGVSHTTLEEVFLRITMGASAVAQYHAFSSAGGPTNQSTAPPAYSQVSTGYVPPSVPAASSKRVPPSGSGRSSGSRGSKRGLRSSSRGSRGSRGSKRDGSAKRGSSKGSSRKGSAKRGSSRGSRGSSRRK